MSQSLSFRTTAFAVAAIAVTQFILQVSSLVRGVEYIAASLAIDDTYYYLQTAWNTKHLGFVTFDGLHPTNGVQFLWFVIILGLALLVQTKTALLFATLALSFLLNGLCHLVIFRIGTLLKQPLLTLLLASLWSLQSLPFRIYSMGMENSLHALVFWCVIWQAVVFLLRVQHGQAPNLLGLTLVLIFNAWTRLDSALFSVILYSFCVLRLAYAHRRDLRVFWHKHLPAVVGTSLLAGVGLVIQLTAFQLMGGSWLPVSALVKTSGAMRGLSVEAGQKFIEVLLLGMPSILQGRLPALVLVLLALFGVGLSLRAQAVSAHRPAELKAFLSLWACLLVGELLYHLYVAVSGVQYTLYFIWYRSPSFIFWICTAGLIALVAFEKIAQLTRSRVSLGWAALGLSGLIFGVAVYLFARSINFTSTLYTARYNTALWIAQNYPRDTIFAAWNTGQLSYFSDRTFINLDGVINSVDYYERVLRGSIPLTAYLSENNVDYVVDYATYGALPDLPVVHTFPLEDGSGRSIQIWRVSPQTSSTPRLGP